MHPYIEHWVVGTLDTKLNDYLYIVATIPQFTTLKTSQLTTEHDTQFYHTFGIRKHLFTFRTCLHVGIRIQSHIILTFMYFTFVFCIIMRIWYLWSHWSPYSYSYSRVMYVHCTISMDSSPQLNMIHLLCVGLTHCGKKIHGEKRRGHLQMFQNPYNTHNYKHFPFTL